MEKMSLNEFVECMQEQLKEFRGAWERCNIGDASVYESQLYVSDWLEQFEIFFELHVQAKHDFLSGESKVKKL